MKALQRVRDSDSARLRFGPLAERLIGALERSDERADEVILTTKGWSSARLWRELEGALIQGHRAPQALRPLIDQAERQTPSWVDFRQLDRGATCFMSTHAVGGTVLGAKSLILGYASPAGNKPLMMSGQLERSVTKRLAETSKFVYEVCRRGGMRPGARGVLETIKVRLIHAKVRAMILATGSWHEEWGHPINQHDMLATVLLFSLAVLEGVEELGMQVREGEAEDYIALWRYIGWLLGVEEALLPRSLEEAKRAFEFIDATQHAPDDDARELTRIFLQGPRPSDDQVPPPEAGRRAANTLARALIGERRSDELGIEAARLPGAMLGLRAMIKSLDGLRRLPGGRARMAERGESYWRWVLEHNPAGAVELTLPEALLRTALDEGSKLTA